MVSSDSGKLHLIQADWDIYQSQLGTIRHEVFVVEQQVPQEEEWDGRDADATHYLGLLHSQPVATGRLLKTGQIGRMAVSKAHRGRGIGQQLLQFIINTAPGSDMPFLFLHAQVIAIPFYRACGFTPKGETFEEAGILHQTMEWQRD